MLLSNPPGVSALLLPTVVCSKARIFQRVKRNHIDPLKKKKKGGCREKGGWGGKTEKDHAWSVLTWVVRGAGTQAPAESLLSSLQPRSTGGKITERRAVRYEGL